MLEGQVGDMEESSREQDNREIEEDAEFPNQPRQCDRVPVDDDAVDVSLSDWNIFLSV